MILELNNEQLDKKAEFKEFVDKEIIPFAAKSDKEETIIPGIVDKLARKGYLGAMLSKEYGGLEMDSISLGIMNEEIGRGCSSVRSIITVHGMTALAIQRWGTKEQKALVLPKLAQGKKLAAFALTEPNVGSDAKSIETTAEPDGENYIINGKKKWITMGQKADLFIVITQCQGKPTAFLVEKERAGLTIKPIRGMLGARASMLAELEFDQCVVPKENMVGSIGLGLTHIALTSLDFGRYTIAWGCVGLAQACLEESCHYTRHRKQFGVPLRKHQLIQKMIAQMVADVKAARLLCYQAGYLRDIGHPDSIMETWTAKYFASGMVGRVANDAVQIHGANGCNSEYPVERYYRDAKINEIIEGTTQMHEVLIATDAIRHS